MARKPSIILLLAISIGLCFSHMAMAKAWPLYCKSGPGINVVIKKGLTGPTQMRTIIEVGFKYPNKAAGQNYENLQPGECSWPDRPMRDNENKCAILDYNALTEAGWGIEYHVMPDGGLTPRLRYSASDLTGRVIGLRDPSGKRMRIFVENGTNKCGDIKQVEE